MANKKQLEILQSGVDIFNQWREQNQEKIDLSFANLSGSNLCDVNLSGASLVAAKFVEADLSRADLSGADIYQADFTGANLTDVNFTDAELKGTIFKKATLHNIDFLTASVFSEIDLTETSLDAIDFSKVNLKRFNFSKAHLTNVNFQGADLSLSSFESAILNNVHLSGANLSYVNFSNAGLENADLKNATITKGNFTEADLSNADLSYADLTQTTWNKTKIRGVKIIGVKNADVYGTRYNQLNDAAPIREKTPSPLESSVIEEPVTEENKFPLPYDEFIKCSVFAPPTASAGNHIMVQVFAHEYGEEGAVKDLAVQFDSDAELRASKKLTVKMEQGAKLTIALSMTGVEIDEPIQELTWLGEPEALQFGVFIPEDRKPGNIIGTVYVTKDNVPFGHVKFILKVTAPASANENPPAETTTADGWKQYKYAFISYASADRQEVLKRVQMLPRAGISFFQDLLSLEPGERWEKALYKHIDKSDVFFLFWSHAAKESKWVAEEIKYALKKSRETEEGIPEIIPIIIEGPPLIPPPPELNDIHFNDRFIYFINPGA